MESKVTLFFLFLVVGDTSAQLSVSSLLEYQLGNLPYDSPRNYSTNYEQVNLIYQKQKIKAKIKLQNFSSPNSERSFSEVSQRSIEFRDKRLNITLGHFYQIFGRGLYLRTYELPGVILEQNGFRKRYGFYRDIDGVLLRYQTRKVEATILRGKPLDNTLPPGTNENLRRPHLLEGGEVRLNLSTHWTLAGSYLRNNWKNQVKEYSSISFGGNLPGDFQIYSEYAQQVGHGNPFFGLTEETVHALYASVNTILGPVGISYEYKDYNNFTFGFNDPPPLVKEHQYILLNRSTHVLLPQNETGWQAEAIWNFSAAHTLTLNITEAVNKFFSSRYLFQEWFAELNYYWSEKALTKAFIDRSQESLFLQKDRYGAGIYWENDWGHLWGTSLELEYQTYDLALKPKQKVENTALAVTLSRAPKFSGGIVWEHSTDPGVIDDPTTSVREHRARNWFSCSIGYQYSPAQFFSVFYGKRRGGTACTAGICYEVLPFEGFELRVISNF